VLRYDASVLSGLVHPRNRLVTLAVAAAVAGCCALLGASQARAEAVTFLPTGGEQSFTVPPGVTSIHVIAIGGKGGDGVPSGSSAPGGSGGYGAMVSADLAVTPGQILYVEVGGNGADGAQGGAGGFNGGGGGNADTGIGYFGGGGGGASDIRLAPRAAGTSLGLRLITAAGGGGGGAINFGGGTRNDGGSAGPIPSAGSEFGGGQPGTATEGGDGGSDCSGNDGGDGGLGIGGIGGPFGSCGFPPANGGGGGGGVYGGGGGGASSAGGGAGGGWSGFGPGASNTSIAADATGAPSISIVFSASPPAPVIPIANPPATVTCVVPKLSGRKLKGARKALGKKHCKLGKVKRRKGRGPKAVVAQQPKPGKTLPADTKVNVTLGA
jgi:hypothetical protein